jgi:hypothetical protein
MSELLDECVPRVAPLATAVIERIGIEVLKLISPEALTKPTRVDLAAVVDGALERFGVFFAPAFSDRLEDRAAITIADGDEKSDIDILISHELWSAIRAAGREANMARATVAHELAHAILHVPSLRKSMNRLPEKSGLSRMRRGDLKPFEDPEWQAWALAGCILMPRTTLETLAGHSLQFVADTYGVSVAMLRSHLKRLKLQGRFST